MGRCLACSTLLTSRISLRYHPFPAASRLDDDEKDAIVINDGISCPLSLSTTHPGHQDSGSLAFSRSLLFHTSDSEISAEWQVALTLRPIGGLSSCPSNGLLLLHELTFCTLRQNNCTETRPFCFRIQSGFARCGVRGPHIIIERLKAQELRSERQSQRGGFSYS